MVSINDYLEIREVFKRFRVEELQIRYRSTNRRRGRLL